MLGAADTEKTCTRLRALGVTSAREARGMALRALKKANAHMTHTSTSGEENGEEQAMMARLKYTTAVRQEIELYRAQCQSPPPLSVTGDDQEFFRAQQITEHLPTCPKCGGTDLERAALQTRSSDEGPTIYMKCSVCKEIVRPVYSRRKKTW